MAGPVILVVEDNPTNMRLLRDVLDHDGYAVLEASTAEQGIAIALEHLPNLVLMDIQLPGGMDGMDTVKFLKHNEQTSAIPVVAVTAFAMKEDKQRALDAGFDGYLEKPVSIVALRQEVQRFLGERSSSDA